MNIDYTKPFRFTGAGHRIEYTYNPPKQQRSGECKITWNNEYTFYQLSAIKRYIEDGSWHYVEGSQKPTLPETFKFQCEGTRIVYTAAKAISGEYMVTWKGLSGEDKSMAFTNKYVEEALNSGGWTAIEEAPPTCENNVTLESILAQYAKDSAHKHEQQCPNAYANEALKAFTKATRASVSIIEGTYTILYSEACYEAEDEEKLNEIIKCITFLENC